MVKINLFIKPEVMLVNFAYSLKTVKIYPSSVMT